MGIENSGHEFRGGAQGSQVTPPVGTLRPPRVPALRPGAQNLWWFILQKGASYVGAEGPGESVGGGDRWALVV